jgi:DNA-directed RNA polymerase specialized sigma24 family protein
LQRYKEKFILQENSKDNFQAEIERLYPILIDRCRGLIFKKGGNKSDAEDIVHDIIVSCLAEHRIETITDVFNRGSLEFYLSRAVWLQVNCKRVTRIFIDYDAMTDAVISEHDYHDRMNALNIIMTRENLHLIMRHLSDYDRELILLWMTPGFNYSDAQEITGIKMNMLANDLKNAIKRLKKYVEHSNSTSSDI